MHLVARQGLQRQRRDELLGTRRHHHLHFCAGFDQHAAQLGAFVRRDAAGDAEEDALVLQAGHMLVWLWLTEGKVQKVGKA